ncbi:MAG TPA: hypothetical protein VLV85_19370 [Stellaceae bacterium]|nr:hypothetical protein [Stellaceae bacterium]
MRAAAAPPDVRAAALAFGLLLAPAGVAAAPSEPIAPDCLTLLTMVRQDPSSVRDTAPLLSVSAIVADQTSTLDVRICTGIGHYRDNDVPVTYTAHWRPAKQDFDIELHATTDDEAASRAVSLRTLYHLAGEDGTFSLLDTAGGCTDPDYRVLAARELRTGISFRTSFFREPRIEILNLVSNGFGSGLLSNCIATISDGKEQGDIFLGTNWTGSSSDRRIQFYVLDAGPEGFKLKDRLWQLDGQ